MPTIIVASEADEAGPDRKLAKEPGAIGGSTAGQFKGGFERYRLLIK